MVLIQKLENNLQSGNVSLNQFFSEQMVPFFKQLELNSILIKDVAVARACQKASIRLRQFVKNLNQTEIDEKENVLQLLESLKSNTSNLIDPLNDFTQYFSELNTNIIEKQGAPLETEIDKEVTDEVKEETSSSEMIKDEEIQTAFEQEARRYIETLQDILKKLSNNPEDKELWNDFGTTIHSLRSSAQILDRKEISDPLTNVAEVVNKIRENEI